MALVGFDGTFLQPILGRARAPVLGQKTDDPLFWGALVGSKEVGSPFLHCPRCQGCIGVQSIVFAFWKAPLQPVYQMDHDGSSIFLLSLGPVKSEIGPI